MLVWPVPLRCNVWIKFADARLSLLSGLRSGVGPEGFVLGNAKWATGTVVSDVAVEVVAIPLLLVTGPSDRDGMTRLVRKEWVEEFRECPDGLLISAESIAEGPRTSKESIVDWVPIFATGGCRCMFVILCLSRARRLIWRRNDCFLEGGMLLGGDCE
jgi:hypothetical protein